MKTIWTVPGKGATVEALLSMLGDNTGPIAVVPPSVYKNISEKVPIARLKQSTNLDVKPNPESRFESYDISRIAEAIKGVCDA